MISTFLAQFADKGARDNGRFTLEASKNISETITASWDYTWDQVINGPLFEELTKIGTWMAVGCLLLWTLQFARKWIENESGISALQELIFPMIVILLLTNNGANTKLMASSIRNTINETNRLMLDNVAKKLNLEQITLELADYAAAEGEFANLRSQCNTIVQQQRLNDCLKLQTEAQDAILAQYRAKHSLSNGVYYKRLQESRGLSSKDPAERVQSAGIGLINIALTPLVVVVQIVMMGFAAAFAQLIEASLLLTALMAPIAVGTTLLPIGAKPLYAWFSSMFGLGLAKLSYNIVSGVTAVAFYKTGGTDTVVSAIFFGLLSPILAMAIASGGGMAIFNGICSATAGAATLAASASRRS